MIHITQFINKMSVMESRQNKDVVLSINDARGLRDDIAKLLAELHELSNSKVNDRKDEVIQIEIKGGKF